MEVSVLPQFVDVFMAPVRDNVVVQAALFALLILIFSDVLFGVINACAKKVFSSTELRQGLVHKVGELAIVLVGIVIDGLIFAGLDLGFNGPILGFILTCLIVMEIGSLMEIAAELNPKLKDNRLFELLGSVKQPELPESGDQDA